MLLSILIILTITLVGSIFHFYFSFALAMMVGSIILNYQDNTLMGVLGFILSFSAMTVMKVYLGKNWWDGLINFDIKKIQEA